MVEILFMRSMKGIVSKENGGNPLHKGYEGESEQRKWWKSSS